MRPRSLASGSTTTRRALTTATPPAPKSHALAAVGAAAGALGSVAVGGLRRDSTHDSAGRRAPRGQRDLSPRRHVHGRCRRRCLLRGPRRRRREGGRSRGRSRSGRRRRRPDFVVSGPSRVADLGAGSVRSAGATRPRCGRSLRHRRDRRAAPGKRARGGRRRLAPFQPRARRRTFRRTPGHRAPYVFGVRRRDFAPLRPCRLRGVPTTERSQDRRLRLIPRAGPWACLRRCPRQSLEPTARRLPHQYAIAATRTPSARQSYSHRGPRRAAARGRAVRRHAGAEAAPWWRRVVGPLWLLRKR